ncbi:MAG: extracellular solute-binding protein [Ferrimicrobium sp.]
MPETPRTAVTTSTAMTMSTRQKTAKLHWRAATFAVIGSTAILAACGSSTGSITAAKSSVTNIALWESHNGGPVGNEMTSLVNKFNASQRSVHITIDVTKASTKLLAALAGGNPPVLAEISHYDGKYVKSNALISWNKLIKGSSVVNQANFVSAAWRNGEVSGQHYRLETDLKLSEVFYNETLFQKAGISNAPTTWTQLATDCAKLKALGVIPLGWKDSSAHILPAFLSNGGTLLKKGNSVGTAVNFNNAAGVATFTYFHNLYANGEVQIHHGTTLREDFAANKIAMIDGTSAGYQKVLNAVGGAFKVGAFVEPAGSTGHAANLAQGLGFVLPKGSTAKQQKAAWSFVQWWFETPQQVNWAETTGFAPQTHAAAAAIPSTFLSSHPGLVAAISAAISPYTIPRPISDSYNEVQASLDTAFYNALTGKSSVASALSTLQSQGNSYMSGASAL